MRKIIEDGIRIFQNGGLIIFPTDTAFGIGCRMDMVKSVERLFQIRNRPLSQATPVLVSSIEMAEAYYQNISNDMRILMSKFWPGALTIVANGKTDKIPELVRGGGKTIGIRMPNQQDILEIIEAVGVPILGPSANIHGQLTPYNFLDLNQDLIAQVDYVIPGNCQIGNVSTVVDCTGLSPVIIRKGAIKL